MTLPHLMRREIDEIPHAARRLAEPEAQAKFADLGQHLRDLDPGLVVTVGRGSSDHAASYLKYAIELATGRPVASLGPSIVSVYGRKPHAPGALTLAISQSGASADIVELVAALRRGGALTVALTNTPGSRMEAAADTTLPVLAGLEQAVAATKSFVNSVLAGLWILAHWTGDRDLSEALTTCPEALAIPLPPVPSDLSRMLAGTDRLVVLGRGPALGLAQEIALKLIETCRIHATAFSAAEALHGPSALLRDGFPVLALGGPGTPGMAQALDRLAGQGAALHGLSEPTRPLHPLVDPLLQMPQAYAAIEAAARARGLDPDAPAFLRKATNTI